MSLFRDEEKDIDKQLPSSSDSSSSSSWHSSSSSDASYSFDESDQSSVSSSRRRGRDRNRQLAVESGYEGDSLFRVASLMRHRRTKNGGDCEDGRQSISNHENEDEDKYHENRSGHSVSDESHSSKNKKKRMSKRRNIDSSFHWSTILLAMALLVWCGVQIATSEYMRTESWILQYSQIDLDNLQLKHRDINVESNGGPRPHRPVRQKNSTSQKEMLKPGCELDSRWQTPDTNSKLLACQLLHELDLSELLSMSSSSWKSSRRQRSLSSAAHLGSGLWRDVWKIRDNIIVRSNNSTKDTGNFVVLKTMKPEHEVVHRNLERHRREAAVMSHLTKSPHVVDLFAYCGNSILTEFASQDLSHALKPKTRHDISGIHNERKRRRIDASRDGRANDRKELEQQQSMNNSTGNHIDSSNRDMSASAPMSSSLLTTLPLATRIDWALQASIAIADLHRSDVIHADITAKQFLVISSNGGTQNRTGNDNFLDNIRIKINDFNRCRFVPRRVDKIATEIENKVSPPTVLSSTANRCTVRIPSAPGSYRSPEEYAEKELTPQMDVYSLGHVLYAIWTQGQSPWRNAGGKRIKNMVMDGVLPTELQKLKNWGGQSESTLSINSTDTDARKDDFLLAEIQRHFGLVISKCYLVDPKRRITADGLVQELTRLLDRVPIQNPV